MGRRRGGAVATHLDIEFTRSGGFAGITLYAHVTDVALNEAEAAFWLGPEPLASEACEPQPDRFTYTLVFHRSEEDREVTLAEPDLDERSRPLVERLTEVARPVPPDAPV